MSKKRIYIAYTGGTIGMAPSEQGFVPAPGLMAKQLAALPELHRPEMPEFELHEYQPLIDSAEMTPAHWQRIADDIAGRYDDFDGFIILHGTDTMAYTASALSFMFEGLSKPVIVTGAQIPLASLRTDARANLLNALFIAAEHPLPEVCLYFEDKLLRGNRATKARADGFDAFESPNLPPLARAGIQIRRSSVATLDPCGNFAVQTITPQPVAVVTLYPGISEQLIAHALQAPVKALILRSFGVGNAPRSPELLQIFADARDRGVLVLNLSQCHAGQVAMGSYATGSALAQAGVTSGSDMTLEAALAKLHVLLSRDISFDSLQTLVQQSLRGELSPVPT
ncbi:MAG: asparaginase [Granulosicoccaceae bacterium]